MLYAWINGHKRAPVAKGERTTCRDCSGLLSSVMPFQNAPHWRHKSGDCDAWSEPEGPWHLGWKEHFDMSYREVSLRDPGTQELHRADILVDVGTSIKTVLELQHSPIAEDERNAREVFYGREHRMFWLVHIHNESSFLGYYFGFSIDFNRIINLDGKDFGVMRWRGRGKQFIEKWKRSKAHVFFDTGTDIYYLASTAVAARLGISFKIGEFALCSLSHDEFIRAVHLK